MDQHSYTANAESEYIDALYKAYKKDPQSIDSSWQKFFEGFDFAKTDSEATWVSEDILQKELQVSSLINAYRTRGHLKSTTNPIRPRKDRQPRLELPYFGLTEEDLTTAFEAGKALGLGKTSLKDIITTLEKIYCGNVGFEYAYIKDAAIDDWLKEKIERDFLSYTPNIEEKKRILAKLNEASVFENFLQLKYIGQKRFSLEGGETTIPALDAIIQRSAELGVQEIVIGMAHRGRLNVLANIIGKTYESIFDEFEGNVPLQTTMGDGDVKYHLGYTSEVTTASGNKINLKLAPNPSHLEAVNAVVEGFTRAKVERQYGYDFSRVIPVLIHGDAALAGQGIGYEVIQMSDLKGYYTGGTIHFVINNQIGFTTDFDDARSSTYCTDLAKLIDAPVIHVNGDDPEAVVFCVKLAVEFRQKFNKDIFIDMVCYRRHGHNEGDEPKFTQPSLYNLISKHPGPREVYSQQLIQQGDIEAALAQKMEKSFKSLLQDRLNLVKQKELTYTPQPMEQAWEKLRIAQPEDFVQSPKTGVPQEVIEKVGKSLVKLPQGFKLLKQIEKLIQQREAMFFKEKKLNWASAELLAYGTLLLENKPVRLAGQDVQRGTFSHRHAILNHTETNEPYYNLAHIDEKQGKFSIYNSLLSENAALGFEFGYAMASPDSLTIWEAQFGDFANGAQLVVDQFISCSETKWQRMSGLVLLLPHGYEGQGPEHSSARLERFLQLSAAYNMQVVNITTPANFFHALRRQLAWPFRKPLIVMSPKSLLRHPKVLSPIKDFTKGGFKEVLDDDFATKKTAKKILLCTGKLYYELLEKQQKDQRKDIAIVRLEQLYPFPEKQLQQLLQTYNKKAKHVWIQEEPINMGAWSFLSHRFKQGELEPIARKAGASPATGFQNVHTKEQQELIDKAFA